MNETGTKANGSNMQTSGLLRGTWKLINLTQDVTEYKRIWEVYLLCKQYAASSTETSYGHFNLGRKRDTELFVVGVHSHTLIKPSHGVMCVCYHVLERHKSVWVPYSVCVCGCVCMSRRERSNPFPKISSPLLFLILSFIIELDSGDPWPR